MLFVMQCTIPTNNSPFSRPWMCQDGVAVVNAGNTGLKGVIAGGLTGATEIIITYPTEFIKTQLQLDETLRGVRRKQYTGMLDCVRKTISREGILGLYRGINIILCGSIPKNALRFGAFESFKNQVVNDRGELCLRSRIVCGFGAGVCEAVFVVTPIETIKVKYIHDTWCMKPRYNGLYHAVVSIIKEDGLRGIYQGVTATTLRQGSNQAIRFAVMETMKDTYCGDDRTKHVPKVLVGVFGAVGGATSVLANTPVDVVKTRMQGFQADKYSSTVDCFRKIWTKEGPAAFYKGTVPRLLTACMDVAITFMVYDTFIDLLNIISD
ncbi:putative tricarboxylate transport protein, mitochondrial [Nilaparvata lugens]|uniref:putative tricarboxylate transport protein, mitochondrial n=1 Tax=Nilaparvata lugens TaxID=108931 RepID=UPI00193D6654|nr:putative tricarboxylate transport protein, mitochondrial [Nilaparvata lugens]XP_039284431.1 putative tricarboxylate transport protein, mitochondrial [Nilaparvata lugens]XP_039284432.1 putative tricarboxylate transport protein, mitochondrial [Nilaparvata lugens]